MPQSEQISLLSLYFTNLCNIMNKRGCYTLKEFFLAEVFVDENSDFDLAIVDSSSIQRASAHKLLGKIMWK